jgi:biopolymer transport protein TolR
MAFGVGPDSESQQPVMADINVTPLVDVMLVLLIIFMIATPMLHQGVEVSLPRADSESLPLREQDPMVLSINRDRLVYIKDTPVHPSQLVERLTPLLEGRADEQVFLKGDREVPYGLVMEVMDILHSAGIHEIALVTQPRDE